MGTFFIILLLAGAGFAGFLMYTRLQEAKAQTQKLLTLNSTVRDIQHRFRDVVVGLFQKQIIDIHAKQKLLSLANNYFIYQTINQVNISHLVDITDTFMNTIAERTETEHCNDERLAELLATLADHIPTSTRSFNAEYYLNYVPGLIYEFSEKVHEMPDSGDANEATLEEEDASPLSNEAKQTS